MSTNLDIMKVHSAQLYRRGAPTLEFGTPVEGSDGYAPEGDPFPCRLSWESGFEVTNDTTGAKPQTRSGRLFVPVEDSTPAFRKGDRVTVDVFPDRFFEFQFNRLIWDYNSPHHWEIDVDQVVGN